jgi:hypothetical protein
MNPEASGIIYCDQEISPRSSRAGPLRGVYSKRTTLLDLQWLLSNETAIRIVAGWPIQAAGQDATWKFGPFAVASPMIYLVWLLVLALIIKGRSTSLKSLAGVVL